MGQGHVAEPPFLLLVMQAIHRRMKRSLTKGPDWRTPLIGNIIEPTDRRFVFGEEKAAATGSRTPSVSSDHAR